MLTERPQGLFGRLTNLIRGIFGIWLRDTERQNPRAVYEQAINERMRQYRDLKEAVAGILYMRTKLESEITERRAEIAGLGMKSIVAGTLATCMTGAVIGML